MKPLNGPDTITAPHPGIANSRVETYLNTQHKVAYVNTEEESRLVNLWMTKFFIAEKEYDQCRCNKEKVKIWRDAYEGIFYELDEHGQRTTEKMRPLRKMAYELVESKVNASIPAPKMSPRYHADLVPVQATEMLIKHEMNKMLSEEAHDESEHATLIDSTSWFKVCWDPFSNTHERSGMPIVEVCPVDTVYPQPGVSNYKKLEYIFHRTKQTLASIEDMYNRVVFTCNANDLVDIVECYYLNEDRYVGKFVWVYETNVVLCNDVEWGIRRRRECTKCGEIVPVDDICPVCGSRSIKYVAVKEEILQTNMDKITNPYKSGNSQDPEDDNTIVDGVIPAGTRIPYYLVRQLPFIPRRNTGIPKSLYGMSEVELCLENQDVVNKLLNKMVRKSAASKTYVTKLKDTKITDKSDELSYVEIENGQEGSAIQVKQVTSDLNEEIVVSEILYTNAKSTTGVTDTDQGKQDTTARSGKAKQLQMAASGQRKQGSNSLRNAAYAGVYELIFKYLLAYSDEPRSFVSLLPDGTSKEEVWSKYMFIDQDDLGNYYYRDDFAWSVDTASDITNDRASMWQLIDNDFLTGTMGTSIDPARALMMYWQMKEQFGYPTAKYAISFLKDAAIHLPTEIEQALVNNPEAVQLALSYIQDSQKAMLGGSGSGGARPNSGPIGNGATQAANVEKTNSANRAAAGNSTNTNATKTGGMQGGTASPKE